MTIPEGVTIIGNYAFSACWAVQHFIIGSGVTTIGKSIFGNSDNVVSAITSYATTAPVIDQTFDGFQNNGVLNVPSGSTGYDVWMNANNLGGKNWTKVEF